MSLNDTIKQKIRSYLEIEEPNTISIQIKELFDFDGETFRNRLWYRGNADELEKFYEGIHDELGNTHFWGSKPTKGMKIRKIHTGLPSLIVDVLTNVCIDDFCGIELEERQEEWDEIAKENKFKDILQKMVSEVFAVGDGAIKFSYDKEISNLPIMEFFPADKVDFKYKRGRLHAVIFKTKKIIKNKEYILKEHYKKDRIYYTLEEKNGTEVDITAFDELAEYVPVENNGNFIPAVPVIFRPSTKHEGRGKSIFEGKIDNFDSYDEVWSQWMLAVRKGQIKEFIPECLIPRSGKDGSLLGYNDFDNEYIKLENDIVEGAENKITTTQGTIQSEALLAAYVTALDLCLQGIVSPSTLGIDVKKLDNSEAQREKEKTTLYTRNKTLDKLEDIISDIVITALKFKDGIANTKGNTDFEVTTSFGGYANPSFEAQVETISKAKTSGIMSIEASVDELYGDDKDEEWKKTEVQRLKEEQGYADMDEPSIGADGRNIGFDV